MIIEPVAFIEVEGKELTVYNSIDEPLFLVVEIRDLIDYGKSNASHMLKYFCEDDEKIMAKHWRAGQRRNDWFITELGLYNILLQSRKPFARKWRRVIIRSLINMRKERGYSAVDQFNEYSMELSKIFYDEENDRLFIAHADYGDVVDIEPLETE